MVYVIQVCRQLSSSIILILLANCQQTCMTYTIAVCTVKNSWQWTEELSETCSFIPKQIWKISASRRFYYKESIKCGFVDDMCTNVDDMCTNVDDMWTNVDDMYTNLIFVVPCIMLYSGEIGPTRCNNCVYSSQLLYSTCFGWQYTHHH